MFLVTNRRHAGSGDLPSETMTTNLFSHDLSLIKTFSIYYRESTQAFEFSSHMISLCSLAGITLVVRWQRADF